MSSIAKTGTRALDMLSVALHGLDTIAELASVGGLAPKGSARAIAIIEMIAQVVDSIRDGFAGKVDAQAVHEGLIKLRLDLLSNDATAESELDKKFPR